MSMTKRHLESLPQEEQDAILGPIDADEEAAWYAYIPEFDENDCGGVFDGYGVISDADPGL